MPLTPSHGCSSRAPNGKGSGPSSGSPSQRFISHIRAPASENPAPYLPQSLLTSDPTTAVSTSTAQHERLPTPSIGATARKSSLRLSHPPPPPSSSALHVTPPQSKRPRPNPHASGSGTALTSPLSQTVNAYSQLNRSSAPTDPMASPSGSNVRPLSGISKPLPLPSTPSPSHRPSPATGRSGSLKPLAQRSIEEYEKLLPRGKSTTALPPRTDVSQRTLLQTIPPQPPPAPPAHEDAARPDLRPVQAAIEVLPTRQEWLRTGFQAFDLDLDRIAEIQRLNQKRSEEHAEPRMAAESIAIENPLVRLPGSFSCKGSSQLGQPDRGLPSGSILEVLGPPGSGKSSLVVQIAVTERLRALGRARTSLMEHSEEAISSTEPRQALPEPGLEESSYFVDDYWDAEMATADQILMIDCEGALTPERISDAAWGAVISLWTSVQTQPPDSPNVAAASVGTLSLGSPLEQQRQEMPEVVRRLVAAVLAGVHVSRVTTLPGLIALLHSLRPTDEFCDDQQKAALPSSMPSRTSLLVIDSLSYHLRSNGGSSHDRRVAAQVSERIRDKLLRLQKPFEQRQSPDLPSEEREAMRQRHTEAAAKLCTPTIVFTNQLGVRRARGEFEGVGRSNLLGRLPMPPGPGQSSHKSNANAERSSMLAPLLNGQRPPQPARLREERPAPSVALGGPEMWDGEEQGATSSRPLQQPVGRSTAPQKWHDPGWAPSFLGPDVWRMLLFRHGTFGSRYAQIVSIPPVVQSELSSLWAQTRERIRARAAATAEHTGHSKATPAAPAAPAAGELAEQEPLPLPASQRAAIPPPDETADRQMLDLLSQLRASLFRWRPFYVTPRGPIS